MVGAGFEVLDRAVDCCRAVVVAEGLRGAGEVGGDACPRTGDSPITGQMGRFPPARINVA